MKPKLTAAQRRELAAMSGREYRSHYPDDYKPIVRLLELGLVDRQDAKFGGGTYAVTPAGRAALSDQEPPHG